MKSTFLISLLLFSYTITAQPALKLFAYEQEIIPGMVPQRDIPSENGETIAKPKPSLNYYLYLAVNPGTKVTPLNIFIKGQWYSLRKWDSIKSPVVVELPVKKTLVAKTKMQVMQLHKRDTISILKPPTSLRKMMKESQVIVSYSWKGKVYYTALKKITVLDPLHAP